MKSLFAAFIVLFVGHLSIAQTIRINVTDSIFKHSFLMGNDFEIKTDNCADTISNIAAKNLIYNQKIDLQINYNLSYSDLLNLACVYPVDSSFWIKLYSSLSKKEILSHKICVITVLTEKEKNIQIGFLRLYSKKAYKRYLKKVNALRVHVDNISGEIKYDKIKSLFKNTSTYIVVYTLDNMDLLKCNQL